MNRGYAICVDEAFHPSLKLPILEILLLLWGSILIAISKLMDSQRDAVEH